MMGNWESSHNARKRRKEAGTCEDCGKPAFGHRFCLMCKSKADKRRASHRAMLVSLGRCVTCGGVNDLLTAECGGCKLERTKRQKTRRQVRKHVRQDETGRNRMRQDGNTNTIKHKSSKAEEPETKTEHSPGFVGPAHLPKPNYLEGATSWAEMRRRNRERLAEQEPKSKGLLKASDLLL